jgi:hypothetical protein
MPSLEARGFAGALATATNLTGLNATTGVTVAFWVRPSPLEATIITADIVSQFQTGTNNRDGYGVQLGNNGVGIRIGGSAGVNDTSASATQCPVLHGVWQHIGITFDNSTDFVRFYRNGAMVHSGANIRDMTANASCTTTVCPNSITGNLIGGLFDLQLLPDVVVPAQDIPLLMNPKYSYHSVKARYCGVNFRTVAASGTLLDESGNGNNLTVSATVSAEQGAEPPLTPTFA